MLDLIMAELWTPLTYGALQSTITGKHKQITKELLEQGVEKLRQDGNVYVVDNNKYVTDTELKDGWYIRRTYDGEMCVLANGYVGKSTKDDADDARIIRNEKRLRHYTLFLALGSVALVIVELIRFLHELVTSSCP